MQNFIKIFKTFHCFSGFEPRQHLGQSQMAFDDLLGYILSISMCMQNFISAIFTFSEVGARHELGTASTDVKYHFAISWALYLDHVNSNVYILAKFYQNISKSSKASFIFFFQNLKKSSTNPKCHLTIS